jgi:dCTP deaminase
MLSDKGIRDGMSNNEIVVEPFEENCLTPVGYDLRIGLKAFSWKKHQKIDINSKNPLEIEAGDTVIIETLESITLSKKISGTLHAMATHSLRRGLSQISTTVDPGWTGKLLISIHNYRDSCVELQFRETFCTLCLYQAVPEAQKDVCRPAGRSDIWAELDDRAKQERAQLEAKKRIRR